MSVILTPPDGGQAFPTPEDAEYKHIRGMSLRDYFAAHASDADVYAFAPTDTSHLRPESRVEARYAFADAMLAERVKGRAE